MAKKAPHDQSDTKAENRKTVLNLFRSNQASTVAEASELCGLSRATVHRVAEFLRKKKLLLPAGKGTSSDEGGKKPTLLALNAGYRYILCYQMLANSLLAAVSDMRGKLLAERSFANAPDAPLRRILDQMKTAYKAMASDLHTDINHFAGVVVGCHGVTDSKGGVISNLPYYPSWGTDIPFAKRVAELFEKPVPVHIDNSNRYDAYAEKRIGQARDCADFLVIDGELGGLGAGLVLGGELWRGRHFLSGEIGHMTVDPSGSRTCTCGAKGCLEVMASMDSLVDAARKGFAANKKSLLFKGKSPGDISHRDVYDCANAGDRLAQKAVGEQVRWLAIGIANVLLVADPELIILQGPYATGGDFFMDRLRYFLGDGGLPKMKKDIRIVCSTFGRERGLVGGAHYVADLFFDNPKLYV